MKAFLRVLVIIVLGTIVASVVFAIPIFSSEEKIMSPLHTINGIPYPTIRNATHVEEELAHADVFIKGPVFARKLALAVSFDPEETTSLDVGIRTGEFWLGYDKQSLYMQGRDPKGLQTKTLEFPMSAAFQDVNQSIDIMFFAEPVTPSWTVKEIHASVSPVAPTMLEVKEYIKSIINKEREP